jgi:hypothetical protein
MYLQKVTSRKNCVKKFVFCGILKVNDENIRIRIQDPDLDPDPLVRGMDLRIRIHTKMSWIRNTALSVSIFLFYNTYILDNRSLRCTLMSCATLIYKQGLFVHCIWMEQFSKARDEMGLHHTLSLAACLTFSLGGIKCVTTHIKIRV